MPTCAVSRFRNPTKPSKNDKPGKHIGAGLRALANRLSDICPRWLGAVGPARRMRPCCGAPGAAAQTPFSSSEEHRAVGSRRHARQCGLREFVKRLIAHRRCASSRSPSLLIPKDKNRKLGTSSRLDYARTKRRSSLASPLAVQPCGQLPRPAVDDVMIEKFFSSRETCCFTNIRKSALICPHAR